MISQKCLRTFPSAMYINDFYGIIVINKRKHGCEKSRNKFISIGIRETEGRTFLLCGKKYKQKHEGLTVIYIKITIV